MVHFHYEACLRFLALQPFPSLVTSSRCANGANVLLGWVHLENTFAELLPVPMCICTPHRSAEIKSFRFLTNVQLIRHLLIYCIQNLLVLDPGVSCVVFKCAKMVFGNIIALPQSTVACSFRLKLPLPWGRLQAMAIEWTVFFQAQF